MTEKFSDDVNAALAIDTAPGIGALPSDFPPGTLGNPVGPTPHDLMVKPLLDMRKFDTGATRDTEEGKPDYEACLSPLVLEAFGRYMHTNRKMADGTMRDADNWQKGIPRAAYMKSLWRHHWSVWNLHRSDAYVTALMVEALCGVMFNAMGYLHELLKQK